MIFSWLKRIFCPLKKLEHQPSGKGVPIPIKFQNIKNENIDPLLNAYERQIFQNSDVLPIDANIVQLSLSPARS